MERSEWERDRKMAVRHVIQGRGIVARQRECVERLARKGLDTTEAQRTLQSAQGLLASAAYRQRPSSMAR